MTHFAYKQLAASPEYFYGSGDGLLFACLQSVATGRDFDIYQFISPSGQVFRNPAMASGAHQLGPRESTISRDMFVGLLCYCFHYRRADILGTVWSYGWKHGWKMGTENRVVPIYVPGIKWVFHVKDNRTYFTPGLVLLLAALLAALRGGQTFGVKSRLWQLAGCLLAGIWQPLGTTPGYPSHLTMLHIYLNLRIRGKLLTYERKVLDKIARHSPLNPLIYALLGNIKRSNELLAIWPEDRLPTKADWSEEWRTQREDGDLGLLPGNPEDITPHSGGDLLFVQHVQGLYTNGSTAR